MLDCGVASELTGLVLVVKELNELQVVLVNFIMVETRGTNLSLFFVAQLDTFLGHHGHEEVAGVGQFGACVANFLEVLHRQTGLVEVNNFALR